jgi:surface antigen
MSDQADFNPDTHVKGADGRIYEKKVVQATGAAAGRNTGQPKTALAQALENAMTKAVQDAYDKGENDPDKIRALILAARDKALETSPDTTNNA